MCKTPQPPTPQHVDPPCHPNTAHKTPTTNPPPHCLNTAHKTLPLLAMSPQRCVTQDPTTTDLPCHMSCKNPPTCHVPSMTQHATPCHRRPATLPKTPLTHHATPSPPPQLQPHHLTSHKTLPPLTPHVAQEPANLPHPLNDAARNTPPLQTCHIAQDPADPPHHPIAATPNTPHVPTTVWVTHRVLGWVLLGYRFPWVMCIVAPALVPDDRPHILGLVLYHFPPPSLPLTKMQIDSGSLVIAFAKASSHRLHTSQHARPPAPASVTTSLQLQHHRTRMCTCCPSTLTPPPRHGHDTPHTDPTDLTMTSTPLHRRHLNMALLPPRPTSAVHLNLHWRHLDMAPTTTSTPALMLASLPPTSGGYSNGDVEATDDDDDAKDDDNVKDDNNVKDNDNAKDDDNTKDDDNAKDDDNTKDNDDDGAVVAPKIPGGDLSQSLVITTLAHLAYSSTSPLSGPSWSQLKKQCVKTLMHWWVHLAVVASFHEREEAQVLQRRDIPSLSSTASSCWLQVAAEQQDRGRNPTDKQASLLDAQKHWVMEPQSEPPLDKTLGASIINVMIRLAHQFSQAQTKGPSNSGGLPGIILVTWI
ncbi:hypothetical protein EDB89DRAFT_1907928 [Lactarius sanguifluus]|nr:hypothetical protein EDB89DRAFT_1907928 [Lactarius sanguifluus]